MKIKNIFIILTIFIFLVNSLSATLPVSLSDQGVGAKLKSTGEFVNNGNIKIEIYDNLTAGNLIYSETFTEDIINGSWNVMLGENSSNLLNLDYGKIYYRDYEINGIDIDFLDYEGNTVERKFFYSPLGEIADEDISSSTNITTTGWFKGLFDWIIDSISSSYLSFNGTSLSFNETKLNKTIDDRMIAGSNSSYNATYDSFAYNQTIPAQAYTDSVNTSLISWATNTFVKMLGGNSINGTQDFNGGWTNGGLTISAGNLFAQTVYVYNLSSLSVSELNINGSMIPASGFDNIFDIGSAVLRWRNLFLGGNVTVNGSLNLGDGVIKWNESNYIFYNGTGWSAFGSGGGSGSGSGILKQYVGGDISEGKEFNITGASDINRAVAIPYQTSDGAWRLRFNIAFNKGSTTVGDITLNGVVFKTGYDQGIALAGATGVTGTRARTTGGTSELLIRTSITTTEFKVSGDVELDSKPDWADDPVEVVSYWSKSGNDTYYSDGDVNITNNLNLGNGTIAWNETSKNYIFYNGTGWNEIGSGSGTSGSVPANAVMSFNQASCPVGWVLADGQGTTPDLRGIFVRGAGVSGVLNMSNGSAFDGGGWGNYSNDSMQELNGSFTYPDLSGETGGMFQDIDGVFSKINTADPVTSAATDINRGNQMLHFASSNDPNVRVGAETAPASYAMIYCMKLTTEDNSSGIFQLIGNVVEFVNSSFSLFIDGDLNVTGDFNLGNGTIAWNESSKGYDYFDGTEWAAIGSGSGSGMALKQYSEADGDFVVSLTAGGGTLSSVPNAVVIPYQLSSGEWWLRFQMKVAVSTETRTTATFNIDGVTLKSMHQTFKCQAAPSATVMTFCRAMLNSGDFVMTHQSADTTYYEFSGDVELASQPTWADDPVEVVSYWSKSGNDTYYSDGDVNITNNLNLGNGTIAWNESSKSYDYFNGTGWNEIGSGSGTSGSVPANAVMSFNQASCPTGWVLADGTQGAPDLRGIFVRGAGTSGVLAMANGSNFSAGFGNYSNDSMQGHAHNVEFLAGTSNDHLLNSNNWARGTSGGSTIGHSSSPNVINPNIVIDAINDGTNGDPRTGVETAPASYAMIYCMKIATDDSSSLFQLIGNVVSLINSSYNLFIDSDVNITGNLILGSDSAIVFPDGTNMTTALASSSSGEAITRSINQSSHGLLLSDIVYYNGSNYLKALANDSETLGIGMVSGVTDSDNFDFTLTGFVNNLSGLTPGGFYYASETEEGNMTLSEGSYYSNPIFMAENETSGYVLTLRASAVASDENLWKKIGNVLSLINSSNDINILGNFVARGNGVGIASKTNHAESYNLTTEDNDKLITLNSSASGDSVFRLPSMGADNDGEVYRILNDASYVLTVTPNDSSAVWNSGPGYGIDLPDKGTMVSLRYDYARNKWDVLSKTGGKVLIEGLVLMELMNKQASQYTTAQQRLIDSTNSHTLLLRDVSGNNLPIFVPGDGKFLPGATRFQGSDEYGVYDNSDDWDIFGTQTGHKTVAFWVWFDDPIGSSEYLISQYYSTSYRWHVYRDASGYLGILFRAIGVNEVALAAGTISSSTWHFITIVMNESEVAGYVDGEQVSYVNTWSNPNTIPGSLFVGELGNGGSNFDGRMQDLHISYNNPYGAAPNAGNTDSFILPAAPFSGVME